MLRSVFEVTFSRNLPPPFFFAHSRYKWTCSNVVIICSYIYFSFRTLFFSNEGIVAPRPEPENTLLTYFIEHLPWAILLATGNRLWIRQTGTWFHSSGRQIIFFKKSTRKYLVMIHKTAKAKPWWCKIEQGGYFSLNGQGRFHWSSLSAKACIIEASGKNITSGQKYRY